MIIYKLQDIMRAKKIINITQMAEDLGMHRNTLSRVARNTQPVQIDTATLEKLCRTLNIMPNDLIKIMNEDGTEWKPEPINPILSEKYYVSSRVKKELQGRPVE